MARRADLDDRNKDTWSACGLSTAAGLATVLAEQAPQTADRSALWAFLSLVAMVSSAALGGFWPALACVAAAFGGGVVVVHAGAPTCMAVAALGTGAAILGERGRRLRARALTAAAYLREREVHIQSILDTAPDAMVVFDARGVVLAFSAAAERQFGWTAAEAIGADVGRFVPGACQIALSDDPTPQTGSGARRDGSVFPMELSLAQSGRGPRRFFTAFVRDLSGAKVAAGPTPPSPHPTECATIARRLADLSTRERQVLQGLVAGHANKAIAFDLSISPRTVEIYRAKLMTKMKAKSLPELVRMTLVAGV